MSNNDNNSQQGAEQRPGQDQDRQNVQQIPGQEQARENAEQHPEQEQATEQTGTKTEQEKSDQTEQRTDQGRNTEKAFTPSPGTLKADEQRQAQAKRESGLTPEPVEPNAKDIDNVN